MLDSGDMLKREGEVYKTVMAGGHSFTLYYGYYEDYERHIGEPVLIYPDFVSTPAYSSDGYRLVTAVQDACLFFKSRGAREEEPCCSECIHYPNPQSCIDICTCENNRKKSDE